MAAFEGDLDWLLQVTMPDCITNQVGKYLSHSLWIKTTHDRIGIIEYNRRVWLPRTQFLDCRPADQIQLGGTFDNRTRKDLLMDIATEELSHLEIVGSIVVMLNKGAKGRLAEGVEEEGELYRAINGAGNDSHITSILYGAGAPLTNSAGVPWSAAYVDTIGEPTADFRSNIAAEARAKIVYERLMNVTDDPGVKEALGFLMTREIAHQLSFEKALHAIQPNFPQGKLPGMPEFTNKYFNMSGEPNVRGPWNEGEEWEYVENPSAAVDGGDGTASVELAAPDLAVLEAMKLGTRSDPASNPVTGADLGSGLVNGKDD
ncbi:Mn-containing catalase [Pseudomonas sp. URMO17WK12:I10]|uniref:manganese catalase family protein n=1 Tax=unclassified Pseudomonas TaxID=196821 RepID=UPI000A0C91A1|nr:MULTISPECIES: manganese catalase family protein [Pseudomonas]RDL14396.1 Mn-containing catalase [Pseudomonas sp. LAMO17WK12:I3]RED00858.1 Mn-containing catalase [Pseudomonas sp. URMO17WK12:I10]UNT15556.1 manganese catalase family protein [Pseudomonas sp. I3-I5]UTL78870.1 manganese catalase family protein [Pseudomonas putida]SMF18243.1 Mn-containing catalase [Pseudomonas sp. LAIL14HWK12:I11]